VTKSVAPTTVNLGGRLTWTMTVTNRSSVAAADVNGLKLDDPRSYRTRLISLTASQGMCRPYTCNLGRLDVGGRLLAAELPNDHKLIFIFLEGGNEPVRPR
jgi:uncharacterized repeat protein (TIGR01451 family)